MGRTKNFRRRLLNRNEDVFLYDGGDVPKMIARVRVASRVTKIPYRTFYGCFELLEVQLNDGLLTVENGAFQNCKALKGMILPSSVTKLGKEAFRNCFNLAELQLSEGLEVIGEGAFTSTAIRSVNIPSTVIKWGYGAFRSCRKLVEVQLNEGLRTIDVETFRDCRALQHVTIPSTVTELGTDAFTRCKSLQVVSFNPGLQIIGTAAFSYCSALESVTIPSTVIDLGSGAFFGCSNLTELHLSEGLEVIGERAFQHCSSLQRVTVPSTVSEIGRASFHGCTNLFEVIFLRGERLLNHEFLDRQLSGEEGIFNQAVLREMLGPGTFTVKVSVSWAVSERMERLPPGCRLSIKERIRDLSCLELMDDGTILACGDVDTQDTNTKTAKSLYQMLQIVAFYELKESSILIELAMWKSRMEGDGARKDFRISLPDSAKSLIMEYCGFAGFLEPAIEDGFDSGKRALRQEWLTRQQVKPLVT